MHACASPQCKQREPFHPGGPTAPCRCVGAGTAPSFPLLEYSVQIAFADHTGAAGPMLVPSNILADLLRMPADAFVHLSEADRCALKVRRTRWPRNVIIKAHGVTPGVSGAKVTQRSLLFERVHASFKVA